MVTHSANWPDIDDPRLLAVLQEQVQGALNDLHLCTEDGLGHLAKIIEMHPKSELTTHVLSALTDLQRIDRVMQRLQNVASSLEEWKTASRQPLLGTPAWLDTLTRRYVMPEEREVVAKVLDDASPLPFQACGQER